MCLHRLGHASNLVIIHTASDAEQGSEFWGLLFVLAMKKNKRKEKQTLGLLLRLLDQALLAAWGGPLGHMAGRAGWRPASFGAPLETRKRVRNLLEWCPGCAPFGHFELVQGVGGIAA